MLDFLKHRDAYLVLATVLITAASCALFQKWCSAQRDAPELYLHTNGVSPGYVLVAPIFSANDYGGPGTVELLDESGHVAHRWNTEYQPFQAILKDDGNVIVSMVLQNNASNYPSPGTTGVIEELDWNGRVVWKYRDPKMTHDFELMPDGSLAYVRWDQAPPSFAAQIQGGIRATTTSVWTDEVVTINQKKEVTWEWRVSDHLDPRKYRLNAFTPESDWAHINSIRYVSKNPITGTAAFLLSFRDLSRVMLVDIATKKVLWESPDGMLSMQHDATILTNGDILVFDNGLFRPGVPLLLSRVVEINPLTQKIVWEFPGPSDPGAAAAFASSIMGGAERLPNGNTLITLSIEGRIMEVDGLGKAVWEYFNGFQNENGATGLVFKARKYSPSGTRWGALVNRPSALFRAACSW